MKKTKEERPGALTAENLRAIHRQLHEQKLPPSRILMHEQMFDDMIQLNRTIRLTPLVPLTSLRSSTNDTEPSPNASDDTVETPSARNAPCEQSVSIRAMKKPKCDD